ncbi:MAG: phosphocholine cytidylyltransferase family protein [Gammaproteobacteria bacterium]|nr:phosphocholine cytidylyltransferase family protein [Gammaproteobacteria bacterium]
MGTRLREAHSGKPKGFVELDGRPIIEHSIARLEQAGVSDIVIVTGYAAEYYEQLALQRDGLIRTVHNAEYADSGSMYSLYCARDCIDDDFLLLESDLVYESRALDVLIDSEWPDAVLLSGPTRAGDEVYVETADGMLVNMSKDKSDLAGGVSGELVGISRISRGLFAVMKHLAEQAFAETPHYAYETDCLVAAARNWEIACPVVQDLAWGEIDDPAHLQRVRDEIMPRL